MNKNTPLTRKANSMTIAGGFCTILSLTIIENQNLKISIAVIGVLLAAYGVILLLYKKK